MKHFKAEQDLQNEEISFIHSSCYSFMLANYPVQLWGVKVSEHSVSEDAYYLTIFISGPPLKEFYCELQMCSRA